jgi:hypothetical protein
LRGFLGVVLALFTLTVGVLTVTSLAAELTRTSRACHRSAPDM